MGFKLKRKEATVMGILIIGILLLAIGFTSDHPLRYATIFAGVAAGYLAGVIDAGP